MFYRFKELLIVVAVLNTITLALFLFSDFTKAPPHPTNVSVPPSGRGISSAQVKP